MRDYVSLIAYIHKSIAYIRGEAQVTRYQQAMKDELQAWRSHQVRLLLLA
jgi:hypothetical protein